jgi:NADPH-dependent 2,4-dienoyl-CoA reductase/sulfur reductase-like enzyme
VDRRNQLQCDVLVVGGGPAGLAAAARAAEAGAQVAIVDDNVKLGGQIWRASQEHENREAAAWVERLRRRNVTILCGWHIFHQVRAGVLLAEGCDDIRELCYRKVVVATGAREKFLPFPGWTLRNVFGAGGLQAMVKSGLPIRGKRVVVAGTGPLLLAVAANLQQHGAEILMICEQASAFALARFALTLVHEPEKRAQALQLRKQLRGVALSTSTWPLAALGNHVLEGVRISKRGKPQTIACEYLACGFHLVPNIELARLLGCEIDRGFVRVDDSQCTSIPEVFSAGEPTGIGGLELSVVEGEIAGLSAAGRPEEARSLFPKRAKARGFVVALAQTFHLRSELASLPSGETIVCRCEDVPFSRLLSYRSSRAAKLQTRCGMGACQGRVCGPATEFLFNWDSDSVRPPIWPVRLASLSMVRGLSESAQQRTGGL